MKKFLFKLYAKYVLGLSPVQIDWDTRARLAYLRMKEIQEICDRLYLDPSWIKQVMYNEAPNTKKNFLN